MKPRSTGHLYVRVLHRLLLMAKLGTDKKPIIVRVHTEERGRYVAEQCELHGWQYIIGFETDKPEDISDLEKALNPPCQPSLKNLVAMILVHAAVVRNTRNVVVRAVHLMNDHSPNPVFERDCAKARRSLTPRWAS